MQEQAKTVLKSVFAELDDTAVAHFLDIAEVRAYPQDHVLCHEGANEQVFYIIVNGEVAVFKDIGGHANFLENKAAGNFFGETALMLGERRTAEVRTTQETTVIELGVDAFREVVGRSPEFAFEMARLVAAYKKNHQSIREKETGRLTETTKVFISYSHLDGAFVHRLVDDLQRHLNDRGIYIWIDRADIDTQQDWDDQVQAALDSAGGMVLVMSESARLSSNVKAEWNHFLKKERPLIIVQLDTCDIPFRLDTKHRIDHMMLGYPMTLARVQNDLMKLSEATIS